MPPADLHSSPGRSRNAYRNEPSPYPLPQGERGYNNHFDRRSNSAGVIYKHDAEQRIDGAQALSLGQRHADRIAFKDRE